MKNQDLLGYYYIDNNADVNLKNFRITYFESSPNELPPKKIYELIEQEGFDLKRNSNSYVKLINFNEKRLILKEPTRKNRRLLGRIFSIFRHSRAFQAAQSFSFLRSAEIETNRPLCVLEKRLFGVLMYSLIIYEYIEGEAIQKKDYLDLSLTVKKINDLGFGHSDCHQGNFIKTANGVSPIDFVLRKNRLGQLFIDLQYMKLFNKLSEDEFNRLYPYPYSKRLTFSRYYYNLKHWCRNFKNQLKPFLYGAAIIMLSCLLIINLIE